MLTIDDANTILEKYGNVGFWCQIDCSKFSLDFPYGGALDYKYNSFSIHLVYRRSTGKIEFWFYPQGNSLCTRIAYITDKDGNILSTPIEYSADHSSFEMLEQDFRDSLPIWNVYLTSNPTSLPNNANLYRCLFVPLSSTQIFICNGEYDDKFYIHPVGDLINNYTIDGEIVSLEEDDNGKFLRLPPHDCILGTIAQNYDTYFPLYKVRFNEYKHTPVLSISTLYRGTPQTIQLINNDTEEPITEFQAYYQGRKLKDNIIELPYDAPDIVDITVDLLDPEYPESTVKLKANTEIKVCTTLNEINEAIEQGITTMQVHSSSDHNLYINRAEFKDMIFINSKIQFSRSKLDNVTFISTEDYSEDSLFITSNTVLNNSTLQNLNELILGPTQWNNCILESIENIRPNNNTNTREWVISGTIDDCNIATNILIVSDGDITITNNTFAGKSQKEYFPSFLYLTGEYTVKNNTFTLNGEWGELAFNMCIIKAGNDFNSSNFINDNIFHLNIVYGSEPSNTFYYCLVDDDKIRAVRLQ